MTLLTDIAPPGRETGWRANERVDDPAVGVPGTSSSLGPRRLGRRPPRRASVRLASDRTPDRRRLRRARQPVEGGRRLGAERLQLAAPKASPCVLKAEPGAEPGGPRGRGAPARGRPSAASMASRCRRGRRAAGLAQLQRTGTALIPVRGAGQSADEMTDDASTLRSDTRPRDDRGRASPPTSPASRRSGPGCRSSPRRTSPRRRRAASRSSP